MRLIEKLFQMLDDESVYSNPFESAEVNKKRDDFCKKYIDTADKPYDLQEDMWECFIGALMAEREQAFKVGYATAVKLLFQGGIEKCAILR